MCRRRIELRCAIHAGGVVDAAVGTECRCRALHWRLSFFEKMNEAEVNRTRSVDLLSFGETTFRSVCGCGGQAGVGCAIDPSRLMRTSGPNGFHRNAAQPWRSARA